MRIACRLAGFLLHSFGFSSVQSLSHTWLVAPAVEIWPMENYRQNWWTCKIKTFVVWDLMIPASSTYLLSVVLKQLRVLRGMFGSWLCKFRTLSYIPSYAFCVCWFVCFSTFEGEYFNSSTWRWPIYFFPRHLGSDNQETWFHLSFMWAWSTPASFKQGSFRARRNCSVSLDLYTCFLSPVILEESLCY